MFANQIIESIVDCKEKSFSISKSWIVDSLKSSIKFHLGEFNDSVNNVIVKLSGSPLFQGVSLPYPKTLLTYTESQENINNDEFEKSSKRGILAIELDELRKLILQFSYFDKKKKWLVPLYCLEYSPGQCKIVNVISESEIADKLSDDEVREYCLQIQSEASLFHAFLALLSCKNVVTETVLQPERLNKIRERKGKLPLYDFKVLNVQVPGVKQSHSLRSMGNERLNRVHLCRGHFKEFTEQKPLFGKFTGRYWWQPSVRGKGEGMIVKDYAVKLKD